VGIGLSRKSKESIMELEIINETENVSVAQLVEAMVLVNVEVSIWSARRKMKPEDFGDVSLPPERLASLGSKNIFDPTRLDPFTRVRSEAYREPLKTFKAM
jgi:hypothetical protein